MYPGGLPFMNVLAALLLGFSTLSHRSTKATSCLRICQHVEKLPWTLLTLRNIA